jgi:PAS domain S-box-containing protein
MSIIRILHFDDDPDDAFLVRSMLEGRQVPMTYQAVLNGHEFENALDQFKPDVILCDHTLPGYGSLAALKHARKKDPAMPFILVAGTVTEETALELLKAGADDYLAKDRLQRLPQAISNALEKMQARREAFALHEAALAQERRFRRLIEHSREAIVLTDKDLNIIYRSPAAAQISGWSNAERASKGLLADLHPEDASMVMDAIRKVQTSLGSSIGIVFRVVGPEGTPLWLDATFSNLLSDPDVGAFVVNFTDVTDKKKAEEELTRRSRHFKALIENISEAIVLVDEKGLILYHSPSSEQITGYAYGEMMNRSIFDFINSPDSENAKSLFEKLKLQESSLIPDPCRLIHRSGKLIWIEGNVSNMLGEESVNALVINYRDITRRREAEEMLKRSEANLRSIVDNTNISYVLLNRDYRIVSFNQEAKKRYRTALGAELEEGEDIIEYLAPERRSETRERFAEVLSGKKINYETSFVGDDGHYTWYNVNIFPVREDSGPVHGIVISSEDITYRKEAELEREKMTGHITQHNKDLEQFAYIVSHNLRAPVANIIGLTNLLRNPGAMSDADFNRCLDGLVASVKKMDEVITDLNQVLQARRRIGERREMVSLPAVLNDVQAVTSMLIRKENIIIHTNFLVDTIYSVKSYIHSIMLNLVTNSIRYRHPGRNPVISIQSRKENGHIVLTFRDNGLGIDLKKHGVQLFGLYRKFHQNVDGKGMGLYMVKTQVEMLGGTIRVDSEEGKGTEFTIEFEEVQPPAGEATVGPEVPAARRKRRKSD